MTEAELFHEATLAWGWGGRFDFEQSPEGTKLFCDSRLNTARRIIASARAAHPTLVPIYCDFIKSTQLEAYAFPYEGKYFIALSIGLVSYLGMLFARMLGEPRILPDIGDASEEARDLPPGPIINSNGLLGRPRNLIRNRYANFVESLALSFLVCHELGHIVNGHVDHSMSTKELGLIAEFGWSPKNVTEALTRQTLEMDADCFATCRMVNGIRDFFIDPSRNTRPLFKQFHTTVQQSAFNLIFAVHSFFRIFEDDFPEDSGLRMSTHPPISIRDYIACATSVTYVIEKWDKKVSDDWAKGANEGVIASERAFAVLLEEPDATFRLKQIRAIYAGTGWEYSDKLLEHWKVHLRNQLLPHAYANLPA